MENKFKTKVQLNWEVYKEQEEKFVEWIETLSNESLISDTEDLFKAIRGTEYLTGKEDGKAQAQKDILERFEEMLNKIRGFNNDHGQKGLIAITQVDNIVKELKSNSQDTGSNSFAELNKEKSPDTNSRENEKASSNKNSTSKDVTCYALKSKSNKRDGSSPDTQSPPRISGNVFQCSSTQADTNVCNNCGKTKEFHHVFDINNNKWICIRDFTDFKPKTSEERE